ncbi:hypothetical protein TNCV_331071 [Trichonephila clavipes]|nr:hypothetical protein TNCV_331071 [Trichonephila clavipes]
MARIYGGTRHLPSNVQEIDFYDRGGLMVWADITLDSDHTSMSLKEALGLLSPDLVHKRHTWDALGRAIAIATPSENHSRPENRVSERVGLITTGIPYFRYRITACLRAVVTQWSRYRIRAGMS